MSTSTLTTASVQLGPVRTRSEPANTSFLDAWRATNGPEAKRMAARAGAAPGKRTYAGAAWGRTMSDWVTLSTSADAELYLGLRALRNRSRDLARNNEYATNAFRQISNNIVGQGVRFQAQVPMRRGTQLDKATNDRIERAWQRWTRKQFCHTAGRMSFSAMERAVIRSAAINGEILVRKVRRSFGGSAVPFALELISPDQLVDQWSGYKPTANEIRMGVEVDEWQRPVAYWLYPRHPGDNQVQAAVASNQYIRVPAEDIIHVGLFDEPWQTRCVPWLHATIVKLRHAGGYEEAEIVAARGAASVMGIIQTPELDIPDPADGDDTDDVVDGEGVWEMAPGLVKKLGPGETFTGFNPQRPNAAMDPFMRYMLRSAACGAGMSYETFSGDYSQSNFSSSRMAMLPERDNWRILQAWLIETFHQEVYEAWLEAAVMSGVLNLPAWELQPELYCNVRWMPRGWDWIDPKEILYHKEAIRAGLASNTSVLGAKGVDIEDMFDERARELAYADEKGLVLDTDPSKVNDKGQAQGAAMPADGTAEGGDQGGQGASANAGAQGTGTTEPTED
jgi:lambda family phage portal protein